MWKEINIDPVQENPSLWGKKKGCSVGRNSLI